MTVKTLRWLVQLVIGCRHRQLSRVFTIQQRSYQVCFACGREIDYRER